MTSLRKFLPLGALAGLGSLAVAAAAADLWADDEAEKTVTSSEIVAESIDAGDSPIDVMGNSDHPLIVRGAVPRLIRDPQQKNSVETAAYEIPSAIAVSFGDELAIAWDTVECRWLYAWRGGFLQRNVTKGEANAKTEIVGDLVYLCSGPAPLSVSMGAAGPPRYFGYRLIDGTPEFLYTVGKLKVTERITPSQDGKSIIQQFSVERHPVDLILSVPLLPAVGKGKAVDPVTITNGTRKGELILVDSKNAGDFTLHHQIGKPLPRPGAPKPRPVARPLAVPLLAQTKPTQPTSPAPMPEVKPVSPPKPDLPLNPISKPKPTPGPQPQPSVEPVQTGPIIAKAERYDRDIQLTDPHVETGTLKKDSTAFSDREFKFAQLPDEVIGADHVRTFDRDKYIPGDILSYQLDLKGDSTVWLMFDKRLTPLPKWIGEKFTKTEKIAVLDNGETFQILRADFAPGKFRFGPQDSGAGAHFYVIAVTSRSAKPDAPKPTAAVKNPE